MFQIGMLVNTATARFHPIVFRIAPMPGGAAQNMEYLRYKSHGHHTDGFATKEEAMVEVESMKAKLGARWSGVTYEWSGDGAPALVDFFPAQQPSGVPVNT